MVSWCNRFMSIGVTSILSKILILYKKVNMDTNLLTYYTVIMGV